VLGDIYIYIYRGAFRVPDKRGWAKTNVTIYGIVGATCTCSNNEAAAAAAAAAATNAAWRHVH